MKTYEMKTSVQLDKEKIVALRKNKVWTQAHLANVSGLGERSIQRMESTGKASFQNAKTIADTFGVKMEDILQLTAEQIEKSPLYDFIINKKGKFYEQITSGSDLLNLISQSQAFSCHEGELENEDEVQAIGAFYQNTRDIGDIFGDLEPAARIELGFELSANIAELRKIGFFVFYRWERLVRKFEGASDLHLGHLRFLFIRKNASEILTNSFGKLIVPVVESHLEYQIH